MGQKCFKRPAIVMFEVNDKHTNEFYTIIAAD